MREALLSARAAIAALREQPGFKNLANMLLRNMDLERKYPGDTDIAEARLELMAKIERRAAAIQ